MKEGYAFFNSLIPAWLLQAENLFYLEVRQMIPMSRPTNLNNQVEFEELDRAIVRANDEFERWATRQMVQAWWDDLPEEEKEERRFRDRVDVIASKELNKFSTTNFEEANYISCAVKMVFSDGKPDVKKYVCNMYVDVDKKPEDSVKDVDGKAKIYFTWSEPDLKPRITEEEKPVFKDRLYTEIRNRYSESLFRQGSTGRDNRPRYFRSAAFYSGVKYNCSNSQRRRIWNFQKKS
jgi:uncharacterized protein YbaA (DUF1428 family)